MKTILFQGDSITDAIRCRENDNYRGSGYATLVSAKLTSEHPGEYHCINRGVSGDRISDIVNRMRRDVEMLKPDVMSLLIGVNGVWHEVMYGNGMPPERYEKLLDFLLSELEISLPDLKVILLEPFVLHGYNTCDTPEHPDRWETYRTGLPLRSAAMKRVAEKHHVPFVPLQQRFTELADRYGAECWLEDGVHPTAAGHAIIAEEWLKAFDKL